MKKKMLLILTISLAMPQPVFAGDSADYSQYEAPITDFGYTISGQEVSFSSYNGELETILIDSTYNIDGVEYTTDLMDFQIGDGNGNPYSVIFGEGITEINDSFFNSSYVTKVYFPLSMEKIYDKAIGYLDTSDDKLVQIYYEGTKEQWQSIFTKYERTRVSDTEFGEEMGIAVADAINELIGAGYDSSECEYFFSATPETLLTADTNGFVGETGIEPLITDSGETVSENEESESEGSTAGQSQDEYKAQCTELSYTDILRNPDTYDGTNCKMSGTIDQIIEGWFGSYTFYILDGSGNKWGIVYYYDDGETRFLEGDYVTVYGECEGTATAETVLGEQVILPEISAEYISMN